MTMTKTKRNIALIVISFALGMLYFIPYSRVAFYPQTLAAFNLDHTKLGTLGAIYGMVSIVGYVVSGMLASRFSVKKLMMLSCFATGALTLWMAQFPGFAVLSVIYALMSVFTIATAWAPYTVLMRNLGTDEEQGRIFGFSEACRNLFSAAVGFASIALLGALSTELLGFQAMLYVAAGLYVLMGVLCYFFLPKVGRTAESDSSESKVGMLATMKIPGVWLMGFFLFSCYNVIAAQATYLAPYTTDVLHLAEKTSSALALVRTYMFPIAAGIIGGIAVDKAKSRGMFFVVVMTGLAIFCGITPVIEGVPAAAIFTTCILSCVAMMLMSAYWSVMSDCGIPLEYTAAASGIISCMAFFPDAYITIIIGSWLDADLMAGYDKLFIWMVVWSLIAATLGFAIHKKAKANK